MADPVPSLPRFPPNEEYGQLEGGKDADEREAWTAVSERIGRAELYWLSTTRPDGRPHAVPIGGSWYEQRLYFNTSPRTVSARNLRDSGPVCVHLESGAEVVIIEGSARRLPPHGVPEPVLDDYAGKYGDPTHRPDAADPELHWFVVEPAKVLFWLEQDMRNTSVRWKFPAGA